MSHPSLPTSEGDLIIPLPDQALIDSKLKHLRGHSNRKPVRTPTGLVVDPINLLQCISGSDTTYTLSSVSTYSSAKQEITVVSSSPSSPTGAPIFSFPKAGEYHSAESGQQQPEVGSEKGSTVIEPFEVEPHARSVLAFRRNSLRQFSTLMEENEDKDTSSFPPPTGGSQRNFTTPLFVISDGIRRTYFPGEPKPQKKEETSQSDCAQESNPVATYEQISNPKLLRKIQSHPELSSMGCESNEAFRDRSVSSFPKVTLKSDVASSSVSIFSSIAGELRSHVKTSKKQDGSDQSSVVAIQENKTVVQSTDKSLKTDSTQSPGSSPGKSEAMDAHMPETVPDGKPKKKSFVKSLLKWGTEPKKKVSNRENNMYSPSSF